ncbi:metal ABC transporter solute-binding protein, Zn/Mn family [uncultured Bacteroides sp.]|uniref:metal ABC transporter solute-binding protein, Zn/Mn family n=1 Tax=uncultured Bacteroides sp. TaxID=162156 RepID=UPI0025F2FF02|nr:zinc ABC transporter substrate-binding protein [uncultured Bacteroides sp.]
MKKQLKDMSTLLLLGSCLLLAACTGTGSKVDKDKKDKPIITVTIEPQRYFTEAIAGDKFTVVSMVPKGSSPETYDPIPQQLVSLGDSKAYFRIGFIGFEQTWMDRLMNNTPHIQVFDTSKGVDLILNEDEHNHSHDGHSQEGNNDGAHNHAVEPHIWNSTTNALILAGNTYKALSQLDKANESYYMSRYDSLCQHIQATDSLIRQELSSPEASKSFMIYHPALTYFARDYGLHQISIEEGGKEPSPAHLKELIDLCKAEDVRVIFVQPEFDKRNAETIAQQTGTKVVPINPLSYDWQEEMLNVAKALGATTETK